MKSTKIKAEASLELTVEQKTKLKPLIESWQTKGGLVIASMNQKGEKIFISFRQVPTELGQQIFQLVNNYYDKN